MMVMRGAVKSEFLLLGVAILGCLFCVPLGLIFILVDDQGYGDVGYHGSDVHTPVLDQLAGEGVKLENCYVHMSSQFARPHAASS